jgi:hypothetical protein
MDTIASAVTHSSWRAIDMTARDKAQAGLWMIQQAILQLIENRSMQPHEVADELGLRWSTPEGEESAGIAYSIMREMADKGQLTKGPGIRPTYSLGQASTH